MLTKELMEEPVDTSPEVFPSFASMSPGLMFKRVLVYKGSPHKLEFFEHVKTHCDYSISGFVGKWNMLWEAGPFRPAQWYEDMPGELRWIERMPNDVEPVLIVRFEDCVYEKWSPLLHLLP